MSPQAAALAGRAADAARNGGLDRETMRRLLILQAKSLSVAGKPDAAAEPLEEAARLGADDTAEWLLTKGRILGQIGKQKEALPILRRALGLVADRPPTEQLPTSVRWQIGEAYRIDHDYAAARAALDETLQWQQPLPHAHPLVLQTRLRRLDILHRLGDPEAIAESQAVVVEVDRVYGPRSAFSGVARNALASALRRAERFDEAIATYRAALDAWHESVGVDHPGSLRTMFNFAEALSNVPSSQAETVETYRALLELATKRLGVADPLVLFFRASFGKFLLDRGQPRESLEALAAADSLAAVPTAAGPNAPDYALLVQGAHSAACGKKMTADEALCAQAATWLAGNAALLTPPP
jgi:tetratricopeptide (TPR) repeat protein